ncbi:hypothetical protein NF212_09860 [Parasalinivibrio latis]|uniref:PilZ domain-containing protein n=1 Tax=Parasalinivibrio latis TaxID=2952610 RepID=UPI0030E1F9A9
MVRYYRYSKIFCNGPVTLSQDDKCWSSQIKDFSLNGLVIKKPVDWDDECDSDFVAILQLAGAGRDFTLELDLIQESKNSLCFHINHIDMENAAYLELLSDKNVGHSFLLRRTPEQLHHRDINPHHSKQ